MKDYCLHNFMLQPINTLEKISYTLKHTHTHNSGASNPQHTTTTTVGSCFSLHNRSLFLSQGLDCIMHHPPSFPPPLPSAHTDTHSHAKTQTTENLFASLHISKQDRFVSLSSQTLYCASAQCTHTHTHTLVSYHLLCAVPSVLLACLGRLDENFQLSLKWQKN